MTIPGIPMRVVSYHPQHNLSLNTLMIEPTLRLIIRAQHRAVSRMRSVVGLKSLLLLWGGRSVLVRCLITLVVKFLFYLLPGMDKLTPPQRRPDGTNIYFTLLFPGPRSALTLPRSNACAGIPIG